MINIILFGPPGSGKGTQSAKLLEKYKLSHLSTGDLLRDQLKRETALGLEAQKYMEQGLLVPDEVVIGMIESKLDEAGPETKGFIFDGFPRTVEQAKALDDLLARKGTTLMSLVALEVTQKELVKRILLRGETSGRADDRDEATVLNRVKEYDTKTAPVADHYKSQAKFHAVSGLGSIEDIFGRLCVVMDKLVVTAQ